MKCEKCGTDCRRDEVDIGVGIMYGPWGCPDCGWSEQPEYDVSEMLKETEEGYTLDQFGGATP